IEGHEYELLPHMADFFLNSDAPLFLSLHPNSIANTEENSERKRVERANQTLGILNVLERYRIFSCSDSAVAEVNRTALERQIEKEGGCWGPFLFVRGG